jgi:hypothetical protein
MEFTIFKLFLRWRVDERQQHYVYAKDYWKLGNWKAQSEDMKEHI